MLQQDRPVKDENGQLNDATTYFRFVAGIPHPNSIDDYSDPTRIRASLVLARPHQSGRWHQIRRHLNGLSHPILGDTSHGSSKTNREWRELRNMPCELTSIVYCMPNYLLCNVVETHTHSFNVLFH